MLFGKHLPRDFGESWVMRVCHRLFRITPEFYGEHFRARVDAGGCLRAALALIVIDIMDLIFAVDSIPAVFAITQDAFIVYTSNICAIIGFGSFHFRSRRLINASFTLSTGLPLCARLYRDQMIVAKYYVISNWISLAVVVLVLAVTIIISMIATRNRAAAENRK